ncbi:MAG: hypothetical protein IKW92_09530 [Firmicutes bacterium]|nr:hypothetical protein [Bacillota bacterium]
MKKNILTSLVFVLALALIVMAIGLNPTTASSFTPVMMILMAAYCFGQYRYGKNYR